MSTVFAFIDGKIGNWYFVFIVGKIQRMRRVIGLLLLLLKLILPASTYAAEPPSVMLDPPAVRTQTGDEYSISLMLTTKDVPIARLATSVNYPPEFSELISVETSGSIVDFWYRNTNNSHDGVVSLEGSMAEGGTKGSNLLIATLHFRATKADTFTIRLGEDGHAFAPNGDELSLLQQASTFVAATLGPTNAPLVPTQLPTEPPSQEPTAALTPTNVPQSKGFPLGISLFAATGFAFCLCLVILKQYSGKH